jgi:hypothetical protein
MLAEYSAKTIVSVMFTKCMISFESMYPADHRQEFPSPKVSPRGISVSPFCEIDFNTLIIGYALCVTTELVSKNKST